MNQTYIKKRSKVFEKLELFTYDEYEPVTNKRCKEKETGKFYSYEEMSRILKLSVTQIKRVIAEYIKIKTTEDQDKFILHGNIKQQYSKKYGDDYDQTLLFRLLVLSMTKSDKFVALMLINIPWEKLIEMFIPIQQVGLKLNIVLKWYHQSILFKVTLT